MIKKILVRDYLKGYGDMSAEERRAFVGRVGEWLVQDGARLLAMTDRPMAKSQNLVTISTRWTSEDTKSVTEGIMLMSALVGVADTWLPTQIYMKSAYRAVRQVVAVLSSLNIEHGTFLRPDGSKRSEIERNIKTVAQTATVQRGAAAPYNHEPKRAAGAGAGKPQALPAAAVARNTKNTETTEKVGSGVAGVIQPSAISYQPSSAVVPTRPKHIDQYVHLLPKATQERAAEYGELMRQLGEARDNMQLLMDDDHASAKSREQWAKQATKIDKKIRAIREELDREWEKVTESGRVRTDAFGNAFLSEELRVKSEEFATADENSAIGHQPSDLSSEQKKRRRDLRKWLIDLRRGKEGKDREKRIEQWRVNWQEYLTLEPKEKALEDEKILEAAKHFGIDLEVKSEE